MDFSGATDWQQLIQYNYLSWHPFSRFAFTKTEDGGWLFACGESFVLQNVQLPLVQALCDKDRHQLDGLQEFLQRQENLELLAELLNRGFLELVDEY